MKLLYAEDEESMAEAVTDILVFHKYQVDTVYDGEEALEYARKEIIRTLIMLSEGQQSVKQFFLIVWCFHPAAPAVHSVALHFVVLPRA